MGYSESIYYPKAFRQIKYPDRKTAFIVIEPEILA